MKHPRTVQKAMKRLRAECIDQNGDPVLARVAQAMEVALQWATMKTVGWPQPAEEARLLAKLLRDDLQKDGPR